MPGVRWLKTLRSALATRLRLSKLNVWVTLARGDDHLLPRRERFQKGWLPGVGQTKDG